MTPTHGTKIELTDGTHRLRFTNRALVRLEEETGKTLTELGERLTAGSLKSISALVWAGLLHEEPDLTMDQAVDRIDLQKLEDVATAAGKAIETALGPAQENGAGPEESAEGNGETAAS